MKTKTKTKDIPKKKTSKVKKVVSQELDEGSSKYYKSVQRTVTANSTTAHWVFNNVDMDHKVDSFTPKGTRILVARYPDFYKIYLYKTHRAGEPSWPNGGVVAYNANYETMQYFYYESVAIHPEGGMYKFQT